MLFEEDVDGGSNDSETNAAIDVSPQIPLVHQTHAAHSMLQHGSLMFPPTTMTRGRREEHTHTHVPTNKAQESTNIPVLPAVAWLQLAQSR